MNDTLTKSEPHLEIGERLFVLATGGVLVTEIILTTSTAGLAFAWPRVLLGTFSAVFILFLANRLYSGNQKTWQQTRQIAIVWAGLQLLLLLPGVLLGPTVRPGFMGVLQELGMPFTWMTVWKAAVYAFFLAALVALEPVQQFFAQKRGAEVAFREKRADTSETVTLTADQSEAFTGLASALRTAGFVFMLVGVLQLAAANRGPQLVTRLAILPLLEGLLTLVLGFLLLMPAGSVRKVGSSNETSMRRLMRAFDKLKLLHLVGAVVALALLALIVVRLVNWFTGSVPGVQ